VTSLTLDSLAPGACARVSGFAETAGDLADRLLELGFDEGAEVEALHRAPLGDPIAVRVDGSVVALRRALARLVLLTDAA
jgi:ferrous iron transport protein A